jgi:hypothetical protein
MAGVRFEPSVLIANENQKKDAQIIYIYIYFFSQVSTRPPHSAHASTQDAIHNFSTSVLIIEIPHNVWIVENIFINIYLYIYIFINNYTSVTL